MAHIINTGGSAIVPIAVVLSFLLLAVFPHGGRPA